MDVPINPWLLLSGQKLTGSFFGGYKPREGIEYLVNKYMNGNLNLDLFITNKIKLDDINQGFDLMRNGKAILAYGLHQPLVVEDIYVDPPKFNEIRIKIISSGICRSDLHIIESNISKDFIFPLILGHEGSGIVESVGQNVTSVSIGDHVIPLWLPNCQTCELCQSNRTNLCETGNNGTLNVMPDGTTRFWTMDGKPIYNSIGCATFSEYTVMSVESVVVADKRADLEKICLIGCCIATGFGNAVNLAKVESGSSVAVWGLGAVGLATAMGAKHNGAKRIIGVDINEDKFAMAKEFGCNEFVNPNRLPDGYNTIAELFKADGGLDYTFECIGNVKAMQSAFESLNRWGVCVSIGLSPHGENLTINPWLLLTGQKLMGGFLGGYKPIEGTKALIE
ncbi:unnamed protein product, partial [Oppiella nova]